MDRGATDTRSIRGHDAALEMNGQAGARVATNWMK